MKMNFSFSPLISLLSSSSSCPLSLYTKRRHKLRPSRHPYIEELYDGGRGATSRDLLLQPWTWPRFVEARGRGAVIRDVSHALLTSPPVISILHKLLCPIILLLFFLTPILSVRRKEEQSVVSELTPLFFLHPKSIFSPPIPLSSWLAAPLPPPPQLLHRRPSQDKTRGIGRGRSNRRFNEWRCGLYKIWRRAEGQLGNLKMWSLVFYSNCSRLVLTMRKI